MKNILLYQCHLWWFYTNIYLNSYIFISHGQLWEFIFQKTFVFLLFFSIHYIRRGRGLNFPDCVRVPLKKSPEYGWKMPSHWKTENQYPNQITLFFTQMEYFSLIFWKKYEQKVGKCIILEVQLLRIAKVFFIF